VGLVFLFVREVINNMANFKLLTNTAAKFTVLRNKAASFKVPTNNGKTDVSDIQAATKSDATKPTKGKGGAGFMK
jgi:hypothetical protein